jgi:hypothetical protein
MKKSSSKLPKSIVKVKPKIGLVDLTHHLMIGGIYKHCCIRNMGYMMRMS